MPKIKPNFVIVGFPRCATTFLYEYLRRHPDICMSKTKELRLFNKKDFNERGGEDYIRMNFEHYNNEKIIGEASPIYIFLKEDLMKIKKNGCKVLLVTRNKKEMANSMKKFIENNVHEDKFEIFDKINNSDKYIRQFKQIFPKNKRLILRQEDILEDSAREYEKILKFLEVKDFKIKIFDKINDNKNPRLRFLMPSIRWINKRKKMKSFMSLFFPIEIRRLILKLNNTYYPANYKYVKKK